MTILDRLAENPGRLRYLLGSRQKPTVYLHIGMHKTGTTSIQAAMYASRRQLARHRICYPPFAQNHSVAIQSLFCERPEHMLQNLRRGRSSGNQIAEFNAEVDGQLRRILTREAWRKVLISGESIGRLGAEGTERLKRYFDAMVADYRIIFYIRPPASYINSAAQERVKGGATLRSLEIKQPLPRYRERLEPFMELFGRDSIELRLYGYDALPDGLLQDFCAALGEPGLAAKISAGVRNRSWSENAVRIMDAYNARYPLLNDDAASMNPDRPPDGVLRNVLQYFPGPIFRLDHKSLYLLLDACSEDIEWMESVFGNRIDDRAEFRSAAGIQAGTAERSHQGFGDTVELLHGLCLHANSDMEKAESFCDHLIERFETNPELWFQKGVALLRQSDMIGAEAALQKAIELDPRHCRAWNRLAIVRQSLDDLRGARAAARQSVYLSPETDAFRDRLAIINRQARSRLRMKLLARLRAPFQ